MLMLEIKNLKVQAVDNKQILLNEFNLEIKDDQIVAIMGKNGAGKSTICKTLLGDASYKIIEGQIIFNNEDITQETTDKKALKGIYLLSQNPLSIKGVSLSEMLRMAISTKTNKAVDILAFHKKIKDICKKLEIPQSFIHRDVNYNMSGGERKKSELLQVWMLEPSLVILDEIDSGLDVDSFKIVMNSLLEYKKEYKASILIITHNTKVFDYLKPDVINILDNQKIVASADDSLAKLVDDQGFEAFKIGKKDLDE